MVVYSKQEEKRLLKVVLIGFQDYLKVKKLKRQTQKSAAHYHTLRRFEMFFKEWKDKFKKCKILQKHNEQATEVTRSKYLYKYFCCWRKNYQNNRKNESDKLTAEIHYELNALVSRFMLWKELTNKLWILSAVFGKNH